MTSVSIEELLFEARRSGRRLPAAAAAQLLCAAVRAADSQGLAPLPGIFLLDSEDGLVLDVSAAEPGHPPVQAAGELGRSLLLGQSGEIQGPAASVVRRALQRGYETLAEVREALEQACPPPPAAALSKVLTGLAELAAAWQAGNDGGALPDALETLAGGATARAAPSAPPRAAAVAAPVSAAPRPVPLPGAASAPPRPVPRPEPIASPPRPVPPITTPPRPVPAVAAASAPSRSVHESDVASILRQEAMPAPPSRPLVTPLASRRAVVEEPLPRETAAPSRPGAWRTVATVAISAAAGALGAIGKDAAAALPRLEKLADSPNFRIAAAAQDALKLIK